MKISEMDDETAAATLLKAYRGACDSYDPALHGSPHPSRDANRWIKIAATGGNDDLGPIVPAADNPPATPGTPRAPVQDGQLEHGSDGTARFTTAAGRVLVGDSALEAHAKQLNPSRAANMAARIKGYDRIK